MPATPNDVVPGDVAMERAASWQSTTPHPGLDILPAPQAGHSKR